MTAKGQVRHTMSSRWNYSRVSSSIVPNMDHDWYICINVSLVSTGQDGRVSVGRTYFQCNINMYAGT